MTSASTSARSTRRGGTSRTSPRRRSIRDNGACDRHGDEAGYADRLSSEAEWIATLPAETQITAKDRLVIDSTAYSVAAVHARDWEMLRAVELTTET